MARQTPRSLKRVSPAKPRRKALKIALVLGGGGLKGFAHIGVFRAALALSSGWPVYVCPPYLYEKTRSSPAQYPKIMLDFFHHLV